MGNAGWVLTYDKVSQAMGDLIWNLAAHTMRECNISIDTEDIILNPLSVDTIVKCLLWRDVL